MSAIASQITSLTIVYSTVYPGVDLSKHQNSASLAFVWGIHRGPVNSPHKWSVTRKMFPFDDVIMRHLVFCIAFEFGMEVGHSTIGPPSEICLGKSKQQSRGFWSSINLHCRLVGWNKESQLKKFARHSDRCKSYLNLSEDPLNHTFVKSRSSTISISILQSFAILHRARHAVSCEKFKPVSQMGKRFVWTNIWPPNS